MSLIFSKLAFYQSFSAFKSLGIIFDFLFESELCVPMISMNSRNYSFPFTFVCGVNLFISVILGDIF